MLETSYHKDSMTSTICKNTILSKLSLEKKLKNTRDYRTIDTFRKKKEEWNRIDNRLMRKMNKNSTVMKDSFKDIYGENNPERMELINDNIPQFWKHSLRSNNKTLKKYIRGHSFSEEIGEEMLQTMKGSKKI